MKFNINKELVLLLAVFFIGFVFGLIFLNIFNIEVDSKINLSDFFSMILTAAVGIYLGITISGRQSSSRFEKEFLIEEVKRITEYIDSIAVFKNTEQIKHDEAKKSFKEINLKLFNFESIISSAHYCEGLDIKPLRNSFKIFRKSILNLNPQNGLVNPDPEQRTSIIKSYADFRKEIFKMITEINGYA